MPEKSLVERLEAGDVLLMDGGTGTELKARGFDVLQGWEGEVDEYVEARTSGDHSEDVPDPSAAETDPAEMRRVHEDSIRQLGPWSAPANIDRPDLVRAIHEDYLRAGADIVISNNFFTSRNKLERIGHAGDWERYARAGARLAIEAREAVNPAAYVAGGIAPSFIGDLRVEFAEHAKVLADEGVDVILAEYLGTVEECAIAVEACSGTGVPLLLAVRHATEDGRLQFGDTFADVLAEIAGGPFDGILTMCCSATSVTPTLRNLRAVYDGPIGAYPHKVEHGPEAERLGRLADYGREWIELGAQIIGGCCGTTPQHTAALRPAVVAP